MNAMVGSRITMMGGNARITKKYNRKGGGMELGLTATEE
jgi:hypothetical protein